MTDDSRSVTSKERTWPTAPFTQWPLQDRYDHMSGLVEHGVNECNRMQAEIERLRAICACAYQMAGTYYAPTRFLDALALHPEYLRMTPEQIIDALLPIDSPVETGATPTREQVERRAQELKETGVKLIDLAAHASAPLGSKCADCSIDGEACPACYAIWWSKRHPNVTFHGGSAQETSTPQAALDKLSAAFAEHRIALRGLVDAAEDTLRSHPETDCCSVTRQRCKEARDVLGHTSKCICKPLQTNLPHLVGMQVQNNDCPVHGFRPLSENGKGDV